MDDSQSGGLLNEHAQYGNAYVSKRATLVMI